jgi:hypothetical protein
MTAMEAAASPAPTWKQNVRSKMTGKTLLMIVGSLALGKALGYAWDRYSAAPERAVQHMRYEATKDIVRMYGLQLEYKREKGTYANDLASLLTVDPQGAALKVNLAAYVDMTTLAVVGDAKKFKIEFNMLDRDRTPLKMRGPIAPRADAAAPAALPATAPPMNADGAPVNADGAPIGR